MAKFKFDSRKLEQAVMEAADGAVRARANQLQQLVDSLGASHRGRPVDDVKVALRSGWQAATGDGDITDPELTQWATHIANGRPIHIQYDGLK